MKNIVIDCNVYISALIGSKTCLKAIEKAFTEYKVCYSEETLNELLETLKKPKLKRIKKERIDATLQILYSLGKPLSPPLCSFDLPDPDDAIYLDLAIAVNAAYIITGNKKHFPETACKGIPVLSPGEFIKK